MSTEYRTIFEAATTTAGGHPGATVSVLQRPDGLVLRLTDGGGEWIETFLGLAQCEAVADVLMTPVWEAQLQRRPADG